MFCPDRSHDLHAEKRENNAETEFTGVPQTSSSSAPVTILHGRGMVTVLRQQRTVSFDDLAPGAYIVRVITANCLISRKLAKA